MKNFVKLFGIIAIIAVIGFSFAACEVHGGGDNGGGGGGNGGGGGGNSGSWPPNSVLSQYGIGGMPQPTGAFNIAWGELFQEKNSLSIMFIGTSATHTAVRDWLTSNGFVITIDIVGTTYFKNSATGATVCYQPGTTSQGLLSAGYHLYD